MTLIIAAQGTDGCVLSADRAESSDTFIKFVDKIFQVHGEVLSFAGDIAIGEKILTDVENSDWPDDNTDEQIRLIEIVTKIENKRYSSKKESSTATLFMTFHKEAQSFIQFFNYDGTSFKIRSYESIGIADNQSEYFLRTLYKPEFDCEKLAEICSFVIQLISETSINNSVQVSSQYPPECYIIQHSKPYRYNNDFSWEMNNDRIRKLHNTMNDLFAEKDIITMEAIKRYW